MEKNDDDVDSGGSNTDDDGDRNGSNERLSASNIWVPVYGAYLNQLYRDNLCYSYLLAYKIPYLD